jgi:hypothetical protein
MTPIRTLAATAVALVATAGVATAAEAPAVSSQHTSASRFAPVTVPGTGVHKGARLPSGARIVYRDVTLTKGQEVRLQVHASSGKTLRGLAVRDKDAVGFVVVSKGNYAGRKAVTVRAYSAKGAGDGDLTGRIYALVR